MKRFLSYIIVAFVACATLGLTACSAGNAVQSISVSGQDTEFVVGDVFDKGDLKVIAKMFDGSEQDVTANAKVEHSANMNKAGSYAVLVSYENITTAYQINVAEKANVKTLTSIAVESEDAKKLYEIGDELSLEGVVVYEHYSNSELADSVEVVSDLSGYSVKVLNGEDEVEGAFAELGNYQVVLSKGELSDSFEVRVGAYVYDSVNEALNAGLENGGKVNSGSLLVDRGYSDPIEYEYLFGEKYTQIDSGYSVEHFQLVDEENVFGVEVRFDDYLYSDVLSPVWEPTPAYMLGINFGSITDYYLEEMFGVEALLAFLRDLAQSEDAMNYKEGFADHCEICGVHHSNSFSFESVYEDYYYYYYEVKFSLNQDQVIDSYQVVRYGYYTYNMDQDEKSGAYTVKPELAGQYDFNLLLEGEQFVGERTAENEYTQDVVLFESFDLADEEGEEITEGQVLETKVGESIYLTLANALPETANPSVDMISCEIFDQEGNSFYLAFASYEDGAIKFTAYKAGNLKLVINTANVRHEVSIKVSYADVTSISATIYDLMYYEYVEVSEVSGYTNTEIEFGGKVNEGANPEVIVSLKEQYENATLDGEYFTATVPGTYEVVISSVANPEVFVVVPVTIEEAPDMSEILKGEYVIKSFAVNATVTFTPSAEGALDGSLVIETEEVTQHFTYTYHAEWMVLQLVQSNDEPMSVYGINVTPNYTLEFTQQSWPIGELSRPSETSESGFSGKYQTLINDGYDDYECIMKFNEDGTGEFSLMGVDGYFEYTIDGEQNIVITNAKDTWSYDFTITCQLNGEVLSVQASDGYTIEVNADFVFTEEEENGGSYFEATYVADGVLDPEGFPSDCSISFKNDGTGEFVIFGGEGTFNYSVDAEGNITITDAYQWMYEWSITCELNGSTLSVNAYDVEMPEYSCVADFVAIIK